MSAPKGFDLPPTADAGDLRVDVTNRFVALLQANPELPSTVAPGLQALMAFGNKDRSRILEVLNYEEPHPDGPAA